MLYRFDEEANKLEPQPFLDFGHLNRKEKELENLLAESLSEIFIKDDLLMPIFQQRTWQSEPDLCAIDIAGNLIIFELKRGQAQEDASLQVMKYAQNYGRMSYGELNWIYQNYKKTEEELSEAQKELSVAHKEAFQLDSQLLEEQFNRQQKLVIIGSSSNLALIDNVEYWRKQGVDIDFLPYRFYSINEELYFEFFAKPYDKQVNPRDIKGIIFDTNRSYDEDAIWDMFAKKKISAYGAASRFVERFNKDDYVFYYRVGWGIVGAGIINNTKTATKKGSGVEKYRTIDLLTPQIAEESGIRYLTPSEIKRLLGHGFYWASTVKTPYLSKSEAEILVKAIQEKYKE